MSLAGPNCWPPMLAKFSDALTASASFRAMIALTELSTDEQVQRRIFGPRVTHNRAGYAYTRDELLDLRHYGAVYSPADAPYGKHRAPEANACFRPHGVTVISLWKLVVDADLVLEPDGQLHTTDAQIEAWRLTTGNVLSEVLEWLIENGGPKVQSADIENITESRPMAQATQGNWQSADLVYPWSED